MTAASNSLTTAGAPLASRDPRISVNRVEPDQVTIDRTLVLGMPQLDLAGISEHWLLKECGHQHWMALARCHGMPTPDFYDTRGNKIYAAFLVVNLDHAQLHLADENDEVRICTRLQPINASRAHSRTEVTLRGQTIASVELVSTFVVRKEQGNNQSVARAELAREVRTFPEAGRDLMQDYRDLRETIGSTETAKASEFIYRPCPYHDFNGAQFLYFASFQKICDLAEQQWLEGSNYWATERRRIHYFGNVNLDDRVRAECLALNINADNRLSQHIRLYRESDGACIADISFQKHRLDEGKWIPQPPLPRSSK